MSEDNFYNLENERDPEALARAARMAAALRKQRIFADKWSASPDPAIQNSVKQTYDLADKQETMLQGAGERAQARPLERAKAAAEARLKAAQAGEIEPQESLGGVPPRAYESETQRQTSPIFDFKEDPMLPGAFVQHNRHTGEFRYYKPGELMKLQQRPPAPGPAAPPGAQPAPGGPPAAPVPQPGGAPAPAGGPPAPPPGGGIQHTDEGTTTQLVRTPLGLMDPETFHLTKQALIKQLPGEVRTKLIGYETQIPILRQALNAVRKSPSAFPGLSETPGAFIPDFVPGHETAKHLVQATQENGRTSDMIRVRHLVLSAAMSAAEELGGSQASAPGRQNVFAGFLPTEQDNAKVIISKLDTIIKKAIEQQRTLRQEHLASLYGPDTEEPGEAWRRKMDEKYQGR